MTNAWFLGATDSVPQDESTVRDTRDPIRDDQHRDPAELDNAPDWNEFETDESGELTGLANRNVGGHVVESRPTGPWYAALADFNHNALIDNQVASSGTAAAREMRGEAGHGTMEYAESIEPQIRDGAMFGSMYFRRDAADIQDGMGAYMSPVTSDNWGSAVAQRQAVENAKRARLSSAYAAFLGN